MGRFTIGSENAFTLLPEAERVRVKFVSADPSQYNDKQERWGFQIIDEDYEGGDTEEVDQAVRDAAADEFVHYESINIPQGKVGQRTKLYKYLSGMWGAKLEEDDDVDIDEFLGREFLADFEHVDKQRPEGNAFVKVLDDNGRPVKKATITKLRPVEKRRKKQLATVASKAPAGIPDDDADLDAEDDID